MAHGTSDIMVLVGPTSSGKSALGIAIAQARPAVIINADAMQMVADLRVITGRPTVEEEAQAQHALYGVLDAAESTSVAVWLGLVVPMIRQAWAEGKLPLLVGGTGMYLKALQEGLALVPPVPEAVRAAMRALPPDALHPRLLEKDPVMAARLKPGDTQRLVRALEVVEGTGRSLDHWQTQTTQPPLPHAAYHYYYADRPRADIYARIDARFEAMVENGALEEVRALTARGLPADLPILRAHGVPELGAYLHGAMPRDAAVAQAQLNTRHYAKRQLTWIRNQLPHARPLTLDAVPNFIKTSHF